MILNSKENKQKNKMENKQKSVQMEEWIEDGNARIKRSSQDIIYAGTNSNVSKKIQGIYSHLTYRQITNDDELVDYLKDRLELFRVCASLGTGRTLLERGIYPKVLLMDSDIPKSKDSSETIASGPATIGQIGDNFCIFKGYVLVNDQAYESDKLGLRSCCEKNKIPVIKESELEQKLDEVLR